MPLGYLLLDNFPSLPNISFGYLAVKIAELSFWKTHFEEPFLVLKCLYLVLDVQKKKSNEYNFTLLLIRSQYHNTIYDLINFRIDQVHYDCLNCEQIHFHFTYI